jgi:hypothetical protein
MSMKAISLSSRSIVTIQPALKEVAKTVYVGAYAPTYTVFALPFCISLSRYEVL